MIMKHTFQLTFVDFSVIQYIIEIFVDVEIVLYKISDELIQREEHDDDEM